MTRPPDDTSIRLDEAMREVMARRGPEANGSAPVDGEVPVRSPMPMEYDREVVGELVREEVAAALAESDLGVEMGVLTAAVEELRKRVDVLTEQLDQAMSGESASRGALRSGLRSMSTGRSGRSR
jgi:hypothetical protein